MKIVRKTSIITTQTQATSTSTTKLVPASSSVSQTSATSKIQTTPVSTSTNPVTSTSHSIEASTTMNSSTKVIPTTTAVTTTQKSLIKTTNWKQQQNGSNTHKQRPPLVLGFPPHRGTPQIDDTKEVQVKSAFR